MKKLIAAAVAAAVIAPAMAIAAGPTLYGKIHTSVDYKDNNGSSTAGNEYKRCHIELPVKPFTTFTPSLFAASPVLIISCAALCLTPSGSPSPHI